MPLSSHGFSGSWSGLVLGASLGRGVTVCPMEVPLYRVRTVHDEQMQLVQANKPRGAPGSCCSFAIFSFIVCFDDRQTVCIIP